MHYGQKLKLAALKGNHNQTRLAMQLGYSNCSALSRIFGGRADLPFSRVAKLANLLGVSLDHLADEGVEDLTLAVEQTRSEQSKSSEPELPAEIRIIVSAIGREEALDRLLLRRREVVAG